MRPWHYKGLCAAVLAAAAVMTSGCSRTQMNYQIAESIGTSGKYENNEPVETPQMKAKREQESEAAAAEAAFAELLNNAETLALSYKFDEALAYLDTLTADTESQKEALAEAQQKYQEAAASMTVYDFSTPVPHLCFPGLIYDTSMAFDGDDRTYNYENNKVTVKEFNSILESLYENGYILISQQNIAKFTTDDRGVDMMETQELKLPEGKKPIIISQDNLNYADVTRGDGIADRLVLNSEGHVKAQYTDANGKDLAGDYDLIPVLDAFVEDHPDFSYGGAKGIISVSGSQGVFGYDISSSAITDNSANQQKVKQIAAALRADGWEIASAGYSHGYMNNMSMQQLTEDISKWKDEVGSLVGDTSILFYPYGGEVQYPGEGLTYLTDNNFRYLCGLWGDTDYTDIQETYMRQTRRFIDGYALKNAGNYFTAFFDVNSILDEDR